MVYISRFLGKELKKTVGEYPASAVLGPRQSGKTVLVQKTFPGKKYVSLEDLDNREFALQDPRGFLETYSGGVIDEAQRAPGLLSYIQTKADKERKKGLFILTGSNQSLLEEKIAQSLAGRVALLRLLPLSLQEVFKFQAQKQSAGSSKSAASLNSMIFKGFYPRLHGEERIRETVWLNNYIETYIHKDVRLIKNIGDLSQFAVFLKMCAARAGRLLNLQSLANDCGISQNTAKSWISVLESGFILKRLRPYHQNFNKRLIKAPKLYFYDTGLLCRLLSVSSPESLSFHPLKGEIFENLIFSEIEKHFFNLGKPAPLYFWRDRGGREIDFLIETGKELRAVEVKAGKTLSGTFFKNLDYFQSVTASASENGFVSIPFAVKNFLIYSGEESQTRHGTAVLSWRKLHRLFS